MNYFWSHSRSYLKRLLVSPCLSCPSVRPYGTFRLPLGEFWWNFVLGDFY